MQFSVIEAITFVLRTQTDIFQKLSNRVRDILKRANPKIVSRKFLETNTIYLYIPIIFIQRKIKKLKS